MRGIPSAENLTAQVEGHVEDVNGVLRISRIHLVYRLRVGKGQREVVDRVLKVYAEKCPAYNTVKDCIECTWEVEVTEEDSP